MVSNFIMCDGDKLLVIKGRMLTAIAKRNMKGVRPLYYEMKKAKNELINNDSIYEGMVLAFTCGDIGTPSNLITIVHNNKQKDRAEADKVVKWLTMIVNYTIDGSKTKFFLTVPEEIDKIIKKHTKGKVPNFFIYAKDKLPNQVEAENNSTMNRIANKFSNASRMKYNKNIEKFDYTILQNKNYDFTIREDSQIIQLYNYYKQNLKKFLQENKDINDEDLYTSKVLRETIVKEMRDYSIDYIVNTLVAYCYSVKKSNNKRLLWMCFGKELLTNIRINTFGIGNVCPVCGKRFLPKTNRIKYCSEECFNVITAEKKIDFESRRNTKI